jgi:methylated-DNA-[protein]-cysteine S-methyltransferase
MTPALQPFSDMALIAGALSENGEPGFGGDPIVERNIMATTGRREWSTKMATNARTTQQRHVCKTMDSPVGKLTLVASEQGLAAILWENDRPRRVRLNIDGEDTRHPVLLEAERQLGEYFVGRRTAFALPLDFAGTPFQTKVWNALLTIPFGETRSYGQIARQIGSPRAVRAVGAANGRNPLSIVAPCHRVIGAAGQLTGFAGGIEVKARLLALEATAPASPGR